MEVASPPRYCRSSVRAGLASASVDELPPYTRRNTLAQPIVRREPTEHVYHLTEKDRTWVTLKLYSSAKSPQSLPTYFEKESITGSLEINAEKGDSIHSVVAIVTGRIITGSRSDESFTFLSQSLPIWSKSADVPRVPSPSEGASQSKLLGTCQWPLSVVLPRKVNVPNGAGGIESCRLPETFLERHTPASIQYDFTVRISRGKLRTDSLIKTAFGYVPNTRPEAPSLLRQLAYQHNQALPGPQADPGGWHALRAVMARGTMRKSKVDAQCVLSLGKPLCYARGGVIPCFLSIQGNDSKALELFSKPSAVNVCLRRHVRFFGKPSQSKVDVAWYESSEDLGRAVWWPAAGTCGDANTRYLEGEIKLPKDLRPTTSIAHFSVTYQVSFHSFNIEHLKSESRTLISEPVEILTMHAKGPRPQAYAPPAYTPNHL